MPNSNPIEHSGPKGVDSRENCPSDKHVKDETMLEGYMLETSFKNSPLSEELLECLESSIKGSTMPLPQETDHSEIDIKNCPEGVAQDITEQFKSPGFCSLAAQTQTPSKDVANTSIDSLVDAAELDNLLDGVEWSPMITCPDNLHSSR